MSTPPKPNGFKVWDSTPSASLETVKADMAAKVRRASELVPDVEPPTFISYFEAVDILKHVEKRLTDDKLAERHMKKAGASVEQAMGRRLDPQELDRLFKVMFQAAGRLPTASLAVDQLKFAYNLILGTLLMLPDQLLSKNIVKPFNILQTVRAVQFNDMITLSRLPYELIAAIKVYYPSFGDTHPDYLYAAFMQKAGFEHVLWKALVVSRFSDILKKMFPSMDIMRNFVMLFIPFTLRRAEDIQFQIARDEQRVNQKIKERGYAGAAEELFVMSARLVIPREIRGRLTVDQENLLENMQAVSKFNRQIDPLRVELSTFDGLGMIPSPFYTLSSDGNQLPDSVAMLEENSRRRLLQQMIDEAKKRRSTLAEQISRSEGANALFGGSMSRSYEPLDMLSPGVDGRNPYAVIVYDELTDRVKENAERIASTIQEKGETIRRIARRR